MSTFLNKKREQSKPTKQANGNESKQTTKTQKSDKKKGKSNINNEDITNTSLNEDNSEFKLTNHKDSGILDLNLSKTLSKGLDKGLEKECIIQLELISSIIPSNDEVDQNFEKCICKPANQEEDKVFKEIEIIPSILLNVIDNKVQLFEIIMVLKQLGYPLTASLISYYYNDAEQFISCGSDPVEQNIYINVDPDSCLIRIKCHCFIEEEFIKSIDLGTSNSRMTRTNSDTKSQQMLNNNKRTKERKIGYIIEKVNTWRKLYNGFYDENKEFVKYSLEDAAKIINISKKSLDDYLLQLRLGRKYGFDFNQFRHEKVGSLRRYVKEKRGSNIKFEDGSN